MGQHGGTGHRPALATCSGLFLALTFSFFNQFFESRDSLQPFFVPFYLFSTSLTSSSGTINCFLPTHKPTQAASPFQALPEACYSTSLAAKLSFLDICARKPSIAALMVGFTPWPPQWKEGWEQPFGSCYLTPPTLTQEPHSSLDNPEPVMAHFRHPFTSWTSRFQFLLAPADTKSGHTAFNPFSSSRNETFSTRVLDWSEFNPLSHSHAPSTLDPAEITRVHFASCIDTFHLLAHQATPLFTSLRGEIGHELWWNCFLSKISQSIPLFNRFAPFQDTYTPWKL
jgi:hypothetical protein